MPRWGSRKSVEEYEKEAVWVGDCLIHKAGGYVPRKLYQLRHGELPSEIHVCHTCDNRLCILDEHHFTGTRTDNMKDCYAKGRSSFNMLNAGPRPDISEANRRRVVKDSTRAKHAENATGRRLRLESRFKLSETKRLKKENSDGR